VSLDASAISEWITRDYGEAIRRAAARHHKDGFGSLRCEARADWVFRGGVGEHEPRGYAACMGAGGAGRTRSASDQGSGWRG
jgi:hypothetical protein